MHWAFQYINKPWVSGARGPTVFDCWGLVTWIYQERYGVALPLYDTISATDTSLVTRLINMGSKGSEWQRVEKPFEGCAVGLSTHRLFHHVGLWIDANGGSILHCIDRGGVVVQKPSVLRSQGWNRIEFFYHNGARY